MSLPHKEPSRLTHATHAAHAPQAAAHSASGPNPYAHSPLQRAQDARIAQLRAAADAAARPARAPNPQGGLPEGLRSGIEALSGMDMSGVRVHRNSGKPAQLNAHAYAQGQDIHLAPGQEQHLPHEAWHVVQQAQGRVRPTFQMKGGVGVNDDVGLEREADLMGGRAVAGGAQAAAQMVRHSTVGEGQKARIDPVAAELGPLTDRPATQLSDRPRQHAQVAANTKLHASSPVQCVKLGDEEDFTDGWRQIEDDTGNWMAYVRDRVVVILVPREDFLSGKESPVNDVATNFRDAGCSVCGSMGERAPELRQAIDAPRYGGVILDDAPADAERIGYHYTSPKLEALIQGSGIKISEELSGKESAVGGVNQDGEGFYTTDDKEFPYHLPNKTSIRFAVYMPKDLLGQLRGLDRSASPGFENVRWWQNDPGLRRLIVDYDYILRVGANAEIKLSPHMVPYIALVRETSRHAVLPANHMAGFKMEFVIPDSLQQFLLAHCKAIDNFETQQQFVRSNVPRLSPETPVGAVFKWMKSMNIAASPP